MRFPNLRQWAPFRSSVSPSDLSDVEEMGTAFGLDESLRGDAEEPVLLEKAGPESNEEPYAWLARRGLNSPR